MESDLGKLFVGGISWDTDEKRLKEHFEQYGEVVEATIMRDRITGRARGFGFVVFSDPAVAERVLTDKHIIDGRTVEAKKAVPREDQHNLSRIGANIIHGSPGPGRTRKIFVGGLASTVTESDFKRYFDQFGTITDVVVMYDHNTQRPRGFGFITYDSEVAVDRVLYKTFHELNGKMVEVKRAVPKELSPVPNRSSLIGYGYGYGLSRASSLMNSYGQGYDMSSIGGYGRLNPVSSGRSGFSLSPTGGYGIGVSMQPGYATNYGRNSSITNTPGYGQLLGPFYGANSNRAPVGYNGGNTRNDSVLINSAARNVWGSGPFNNPTDPSGVGAFLGSGSGNVGGSFGNTGAGADWGSYPVASQGGGSPSGFIGGNLGYAFGDRSAGMGGSSYGRNTGTTSAVSAPSFAAASAGVFPTAYGDLYRGGSYGDSTWRTIPSELEASGSFGFGFGSAALDVASKPPEGHVGSYNGTNRQQNRGLRA